MTPVVVGVGVCCVHGIGDESVLDAASAPWTGVGLVPALDGERYVRHRKSLKLMNRQGLLAVAAARHALVPEDRRDEAGLFMGVGMSGGEISQLAGLLDASLTDEGALDLGRMGQEGLGRLNPLLSFQVLNNMPLCHVSIELGLGGPHGAFYGDSLQAIARGAAAVRSGEAPWALCGGTDAPLNTVSMALRGKDGPPPAEGAALIVLRGEERPEPGSIIWEEGGGGEKWMDAACLAGLLGDTLAASGALAAALAVRRLRARACKSVGMLRRIE